MNDAITNKVLAIIDQVQAGIQNNAGAALQATLQVIRINGVGDILYGILFLFLMIASAFISKTFISYCYKNGEKDSAFPAGAVGTISLLFSGFFLYETCSLLFNIWTYVAIYSPKLALAHEIIEKVIK